MWLYAAVALGAPEICDGLDNDGDGNADEAPVLVFMDTDDDGQGDPWAPVIRSDCALPANQVANDRDCDDGDDLIFEGASEVCNGLDDDCDGQIDEDGCSSAVRRTRLDSTYQVYMSTWTWNQGRNQCQSIGYDLVVIDDSGENTFVTDIVGDQSGFYFYFWIGLWDQDSNNSYFWVDGSPVTYDAWWGSEPNSGSRDCAYSDYSYTWADWSCNDADGTETLCEVECAPRTWYADADGDGFGTGLSSVDACQAPPNHVANSRDCNDGAAAINPTATEVCGGGDEDCNPATNGTEQTYYRDSDGDGYGDAGATVAGCTQPTGYVADATDCDDTDGTAFPGATEVCDGDLEDCNGTVDQGVQGTFYEDSDGDGFGNVGQTLQACAAPSGYTSDTTDCDDTDGTAFPGATEVCDGDLEDCNGSVDQGVQGTFYEDSDGDGFGNVGQTLQACAAPSGYTSDTTDCDDTDGTAFPGAIEVCDGDLEDCNGTVDQGVQDTFYEDGDGDGFGHVGQTLQACAAPSGYVATSTDCDDTDGTAFPGATEVCDGDLEDCDGTVDQGVLGTFYEDSDGDGFGNVGQTLQACAAPSGYVATSTDCDDTDGTAYPGATEVCDGDLEDCNGTVDQGLTSTYWLDADGDGYGSASSATGACSAPSGFVHNDLDCNDGDDTAYPGATEVCDHDLEDCGGTVDDGVTTTYFRDADDDGHGSASPTVQDCSMPPGYALAADDCDDTEPQAWTGALEVCDGVDNDCNGSVDEGVQTSYWTDGDDDDFGDASSEVLACSQPAGTATNPNDCDDTRGEAYPGAPELCNQLDDDCDSVADNGTADVQWYVDGDGDGVGDVPGAFQCDPPAGQVSVAGDCEDTDPDIHPGADEVCDTVDNDCDGTIDINASDASTWFYDLDEDGYGATNASVQACGAPTGAVATSGDCNDGDVAVNPDAEEVCNGVDDNCDGQVDLDAPSPTQWYEDADQDGFGDAAGTALSQCAPPSGYVTDSTDCDDTAFGIHPGALEECDSIDHDCDGVLDNDTMDRQYYLDGDGDGYGSTAPGSIDCTAAPGEVANSDDCDDANPLVSPAGTEVCNGIDDDCDGILDTDAVVGTDTWYLDADGDGFGDLGAPVIACSQPSGTVADATDCDDASDQVFPGAIEACDGADDDCNGAVDDGAPAEAWYPDLDGDGFGDAGAEASTTCDPASGEVADHSDCDDTTDAVNPDATEIPNNGIDEDCDGQDATGPLPPTPTDPPDTGDTAGGAPLQVRDAGCTCDAGAKRSPWMGWLRQ